MMMMIGKYAIRITLTLKVPNLLYFSLFH